MPRRTIVIGRQPAQFDFQDDFGPLNNGLAYAAGQFLASGRDRAQIETQRQAQESEAVQGDQELDLRKQDLELRRLALEGQNEDRRIGREQQAEEIRNRKVANAADAAAKMRDDMGAVGRYALDWIRGGNPSGTPKANASSPSTDLNREKFNYERAVQEIGNPEYDLEVVEGVDLNGVPFKREVKKPLSDLERKSRVDRINARFNELNGATWTPIPLPDDQPGQQPQGMGPVRPPVEVVTDSGADLTTTALRGALPTAPATAPAAPSVGSGQEQARNQFLAGAGGWGSLVPSWIGPNNGAPNAGQTPAPAAQPPVDPRVALTNAGINPSPETGITLDDLTSPDPVQRESALMRLPPLERLKAIDVLLASGIK